MLYLVVVRTSTKMLPKSPCDSTTFRLSSYSGFLTALSFRSRWIGRRRLSKLRRTGDIKRETQISYPRWIGRACLFTSTRDYDQPPAQTKNFPPPGMLLHLVLVGTIPKGSYRA